MRDFLPADKARRERVLAVIRERYRAHGFDEIETPVVEEYDRLHAGIGGDNEKLAFNVLARSGCRGHHRRGGGPGGSQRPRPALRPDRAARPLLRDAPRRAAGGVPLDPDGAGLACERPQKGATASSCSATSTSSATTRRAPRPSSSSRRSTRSTPSVSRGHRARQRPPRSTGCSDASASPRTSAPACSSRSTSSTRSARGRRRQLRERGATAAAVDAFEAFLRRPQTLEYNPYGERQIRKALPENAPDDLVAHLVGLGEAVAAARPAAEDRPDPLQFDPFLVRGMGYYTGTIFELAHPSVDYSLGGGGRYDGMIGRFLGQQVPAVGFSIGFERIVDLLESADDAAAQAVVLVHADVPVAELVAHKAALIAGGARVRLERRTKNLKACWSGPPTLHRIRPGARGRGSGGARGQAAELTRVRPVRSPPPADPPRRNAAFTLMRSDRRMDAVDRRRIRS
jgi:histidyl-tRNA synthetase